MIREQLQNLAEAVRDEILETRQISIDDHSYMANERHENPLIGMCGPAVDKFIELAKSRFNVARLSFRVTGQRLWDQGMHVIAEVETEEGTFEVDPTLGQYIPDAQMVYGPNDKYPMKAFPDSMYRW